MKTLSGTLYAAALIVLSLLQPGCRGNDGLSVEQTGFLFSTHRSPDEVKNDGPWKDGRLPLTVRSPGNCKAVTYLWMRNSFRISGDPSLYRGISIRRVRFAESVYINSVLIGERKARDTSFMFLPGNYSIPAGLLRKGVNDVLIRITTSPGEFCGITEGICVLGEDAMGTIVMKDMFLYTLVPFGILFLNTVLILFFLLLFFNNIRDRRILYTAFALFVYLSHMLNNFTPYSMSHASMNHLNYMTSGPFFGLLIIFVMQLAAGIFFTGFNYVVTSLLLGISMLMALNLYGPGSHIFYTVLHAAAGVTGITSIGFLVFRIEKHKKTAGRHHLLFPALFAGLILVMKTCSDLFGFFQSDVFIVYASPLLIVFFMALYAREFMGRKRDLDRMYDALKKRTAKNVSITESSQRKLEQAIAFIREHYTSDLSREGLAAAVGLSPNYMSTIFTAHTGEKISDYINRLRVEDAAKRLLQTDASIIDIALSVGFESLSTFNRAFKKTTNLTPTAYRTHRKAE